MGRLLIWHVGSSGLHPQYYIGLVHAYNLNTPKVKAKGSEVQGHSQLRGGLKATFGCVEACFKKY